MWGKDWPSVTLRSLLEEVGLNPNEIEKYAFSGKNPRRMAFIVKNAPYEWQKGMLLLLLLYFFQDTRKVKRILGYSDEAPLLRRNFFRSLLWKYCDKFYTGENYCNFCREYINFNTRDLHFGQYEHLVLYHFRQLLVGPRDYAGLCDEEAIKRLQSLRKYFAGERQ